MRFRRRRRRRAGEPKAAVAAADLFRAAVGPLLERVGASGCHQGSKPKGGFSLIDAEPALAGGESGAAIVPGKPDEELAARLHLGQRAEMPKDAAPLSADDVALLRRWIAAGAVWPEGLTLPTSE